MPEVILASAGSFWEELFRHDDIAFFACLFGTLVLIVAVPVIASAWRQVARDRADADLKRSMIERGLSAEEIERVLKARSSEE
jgi:hypothetical protein